MLKRKNFTKDLTVLFYINLVVIILILSAFNLVTQKQSQIQVLGAKTDSNFWQEFVIKHPTYRDGWVELNRMDKVKEIDPNFQLP